MSPEDEEDLQQKDEDSDGQENCSEDGVGLGGIPVLCQTANESHYNHKVGSEGVPSVLVKGKEICTNKNNDFHCKNGQDYGGGGGLADGVVGPVGDDRGHVEQGCNGGPGGVNGKAVVDKHPDHPDVSFAALLEHDCCVVVQCTVGQHQAHVDSESNEHQHRQCRLKQKERN